MCYSTVVLRNSNIPSSFDRDYLLRQLDGHFRIWSRQARGSRFRLHWGSKCLVLCTDSLFILKQWQAIERAYVNYLIEREPVEEWSVRLAA